MPTTPDHAAAVRAAADRLLHEVAIHRDQIADDDPLSPFARDIELVADAARRALEALGIAEDALRCIVGYSGAEQWASPEMVAEDALIQISVIKALAPALTDGAGEGTTDPR